MGPTGPWATGPPCRRRPAARASWASDISQLSSKDPIKQAHAADDLAERSTSPDADKIVGALIVALGNSDTQTRYQIAKLFAEFGTAAKSAVPALIKVLDSDKDNLVRAAAARSLGFIAEPASPAVPALAKAIVDKDVRVRRNAVHALLRIHPGPAIGLPLYVKALQDADPGVVADVLATAAEMGEKVVPGATIALKNPKARYWALLLLGEVGPAAKTATPEVAKLLSSDEVEVRMQAALTLGAIGPAAKAAGPELIKALGDKHAAVRFAAAYALGKIGVKEATGPLEKEMAAGNSPFLQTVCAWAVVQINPDNRALTARAIKRLAAALASKDVRVRRGAAKGLADLRIDPEAAIGALLAAMNDADPQVVESVSEALAKWGNKDVTQIAAALQDKTRRECAVMTLGRMGKRAKAAVPALAAALKAATPDFRREALFALAKIGPDALEALPQVELELADPCAERAIRRDLCAGQIGARREACRRGLAKESDQQRRIPRDRQRLGAVEDRGARRNPGQSGRSVVHQTAQGSARTAADRSGRIVGRPRRIRRTGPADAQGCRRVRHARRPQGRRRRDQNDRRHQPEALARKSGAATI